MPPVYPQMSRVVFEVCPSPAGRSVGKATPLVKNGVMGPVEKVGLVPLNG